MAHGDDARRHRPASRKAQADRKRARDTRKASDEAKTLSNKPNTSGFREDASTYRQDETVNVRPLRMLFEPWIDTDDPLLELHKPYPATPPNKPLVQNLELFKWTPFFTQPSSSAESPTFARCEGAEAAHNHDGAPVELEIHPQEEERDKESKKRKRQESDDGVAGDERSLFEEDNSVDARSKAAMRYVSASESRPTKCPRINQANIRDRYRTGGNRRARCLKRADDQPCRTAWDHGRQNPSVVTSAPFLTPPATPRSFAQPTPSPTKRTPGFFDAKRWMRISRP